MTVGIIGGSGFIGSRLCCLLNSKSFPVSNFDKRLSDYKLFPNNVDTTIADVRNLDELDKWVKYKDCLFLLAAEHADNVSPTSLYYDVNVEGARNTCLTADKNGVKKIIFTSSVAVYGLDAPDADEQTRPSPFNDYGKSKLQAEEILKEWVSADKGRSLVIIRPCVVFGEGNRGNVYNLLRQIASGKFIQVGDGKNKKSMAYVGNIVEFLYKCMDVSTGTHIYNYVDKPDITVDELVEVVCERLAIKKSKVRMPYWAGMFAGYLFDLVSLVFRINLPISSVRIKKFCAETTVSTKELEMANFKRPFTIKDGLKYMIDSDINRP